MENKIIKVLIVDDSRVARQLLTHIIESDPEMKVVGLAENGEQALKWLETQSCDVITMDIHMPNLNGFQVTQKIMEFKPTPIAIISAGYTLTDNLLAFRTMEVGALAILEKPAGLGDSQFNRRAKEIIDTLKMISDIKVVTRRQKRLPGETQPPVFQKNEHKKEIRAVGIGASLGGPLAIAKILEELPETFPIPIFIVQHIAAGFVEDFIKWLSERSPLKIYLAKEGTKAQPGSVYIAADSCHMEISEKGIIHLDYNKTTTIQPSVDRLFKSMAKAYGPHCIAVLLTGMGKDGAQELLTLKKAGAYTIAQNEESCLMFGMPKEAILMGAVSEILPLHMISSKINALIRHVV